MRSLHVIGDSISMHYGPYLEKYLSAWFIYSRKGDAVNGVATPEGPNGQDSPMTVSYIKRCVSARAHWDVALVNCGLWDIRDRSGTLQTELTSYAADLRAVARLMPSICDTFLWVRTTPVDDVRHNAIKSDYLRHNADVVQYNAVADRIFTSAGVPTIDLYDFCIAIGLEGAFLDHIHFTSEVRQLQAAFLAGELVARFIDPIGSGTR